MRGVCWCCLLLLLFVASCELRVVCLVLFVVCCVWCMVCSMLCVNCSLDVDGGVLLLVRYWLLLGV